MTTRYPAVAGHFYPADSRQLRTDVEHLLTYAFKPALSPKALIAPHAGYPYSGPIAATAYNTLQPLAATIRRVVLLGPSHRVPLRGIATPGCDDFQTPLGNIALDTNALETIAGLESVGCYPQAHTWEHSLEVHLPFLQTVLNDFSLVPLVVGNTPPATVAAVLEALWGEDETLIVVSSDLSHYHPYPVAQEIDRATTRAIEQFSTTLHGEQACGCRPLNGLLYIAAQRGLQLTTLDLRNSGDTAGGRDQVVGYGAYALH